MAKYCLTPCLTPWLGLLIYLNANTYNDTPMRFLLGILQSHIQDNTVKGIFIVVSVQQYVTPVLTRLNIVRVTDTSFFKMVLSFPNNYAFQVAFQ